MASQLLGYMCDLQFQFISYSFSDVPSCELELTHLGERLHPTTTVQQLHLGSRVNGIKEILLVVRFSQSFIDNWCLRTKLACLANPTILRNPGNFTTY